MNNSISGMKVNLPNGHGKYAAPDDRFRHARFPLPRPLSETTSHSTRLKTTAAKSLVIPQAGERDRESLHDFHFNACCNVSFVITASLPSPSHVWQLHKKGMHCAAP
jgi:hypothetical protein